MIPHGCMLKSTIMICILLLIIFKDLQIRQFATKLYILELQFFASPEKFALTSFCNQANDT